MSELDGIYGAAASLQESTRPLCEKWSQMESNATGQRVDFLEGVDGEWNRGVLATMLEHQGSYLGSMTESTRSSMLGDFEKYAFPILRGVFSSLVAPELVSVQPMKGPTSQVFTMQFHYGSTKGRIKRGDPAFSYERGHNADYSYTSELVKEETAGAGTGSVANFTGTFDYGAPRPRTIVIESETGTGTAVRVTDDGNGNLVGSVAGGGTNKVDYVTGNFDVTFNADVTAGVPVLVTYEYDSEGSQNTPQMDLILQSTTVTSRARKLRAHWSQEAAQDLKALYGSDAELELVAAMVEEIKAEINREIVVDIERCATGGRVAWSKTPAAGVDYQIHKQSFIDALVELDNKIFLQTRRIQTNWLVADVETCNVIETLPSFVAEPVNASTAGMKRIGVLNGRWKVYKDPYMRPQAALGDPANAKGKFLLGYKGESFFQAGYVYAPYVGLYATPSYMLDDHVGRRGIATRYGKKVLLPTVYGVGTVNA